MSLAASSLISAISPEKSESGPETTLTDSPIENCARVRGRSAVSRFSRPVDLGLAERDGLLLRADEPGHARGVFLTSVQESSFRSMFTST